MLKRLFNDRLCAPGDLPASRDDMEVIGVFNPGAVQVGDEVVLLVRVSERPRERREGQVASPRCVSETGAIEIDWFPEEDVEHLDMRIFKDLRSGRLRLSFWSYLRVLRSADGRSIASTDGPAFLPEAPWEEFGVEDPRITPIGDTYWFTYVAVSRHGPCTALASTKDFKTFDRHGIVFTVENKDVVLFPEKHNGLYMCLHRPLALSPFGPPEMWYATSPDMIFWGHHQFLLGGVSDWECSRVGAGAPPIRVDAGWLELYHGNQKDPNQPGVGQYAAAVAILDPADPHRIVRRSHEPAMIPETDFDKEGFVPNVVFPTGIVDRGEIVQVYYGAADTSTGVVEFSKADLVGSTVEV